MGPSDGPDCVSDRLCPLLGQAATCLSSNGTAPPAGHSGQTPTARCSKPELRKCGSPCAAAADGRLRETGLGDGRRADLRPMIGLALASGRGAQQKGEAHHALPASRPVASPLLRVGGSKTQRCTRCRRRPPGLKLDVSLKPRGPERANSQAKPRRRPCQARIEPAPVEPLRYGSRSPGPADVLAGARCSAGRRLRTVAVSRGRLWLSGGTGGPCQERPTRSPPAPPLVDLRLHQPGTRPRLRLRALVQYLDPPAALVRANCPAGSQRQRRRPDGALRNHRGSAGVQPAPQRTVAVRPRPAASGVGRLGIWLCRSTHISDTSHRHALMVGGAAAKALAVPPAGCNVEGRLDTLPRAIAEMIAASEKRMMAAIATR